MAKTVRGSASGDQQLLQRSPSSEGEGEGAPPRTENAVSAQEQSPETDASESETGRSQEQKGRGRSGGPIEVHSEWRGLRVTVIDDAMHPPQMARIQETERPEIERLLKEDPEIQGSLKRLGIGNDLSADDKICAFIDDDADDSRVALSIIANSSSDASRMIDEYQNFRKLMTLLREEIEDVEIADPYLKLPDMKDRDLILLDYYLEGSSGTGELAIKCAQEICQQSEHPSSQQIVLMSSLDKVRDFRERFIEQSEIQAASFAFVAKPDLNSPWKVKAHLGMLHRARPYGPAMAGYRSALDASLSQAKDELLACVDDLDIGDYAYLQREALMNDGHPLGDYVFWLLSSKLLSASFERDEMRKQQAALDRLKFVGEPFTPTEPSTVVASLFHSALISSGVGPLGPHPRANGAEGASTMPLVQLGDVFFDHDRTKAVVVLNAACDLSFAPEADSGRQPDEFTPVILLPGVPVHSNTPKNSNEYDSDTAGLVHQGEVYRIDWKFSRYRSVPLFKLGEWLTNDGFDIEHRDRLRPLFSLKLQQEFAAHLVRVGPPTLPPVITKASGLISICNNGKANTFVEFNDNELRLSRFNGKTRILLTPRLVGHLKDASEIILSELEQDRDSIIKANETETDTGKNRKNKKAAENLGKKIEAIIANISSDDFWVRLLDGHEVKSEGALEKKGSLGFVIDGAWDAGDEQRVVLVIRKGESLGARPVLTGQVA